MDRSPPKPPEKFTWEQANITATRKILKRYRQVKLSPGKVALRRRLFEPARAEGTSKRKRVVINDKPTAIVEPKRAKLSITTCAQTPCKLHGEKSTEATYLRSILKKKMDLQDSPRKRTMSSHEIDDQLKNYLDELKIAE